MSADAIRIVEQALERFNRADVEGAIELAHPEGVIVSMLNRVGTSPPPPYRGHEGMRQYFADIAAAWHEVRVAPTHFRAAGDAVIAMGRLYAQGPGGVLDAPVSWVFKLRDGLIVRGEVFADERAALAALGWDQDTDAPPAAQAS